MICPPIRDLVTDRIPVAVTYRVLEPASPTTGG